MKKLRLLAAKESSEPESTIGGKATSPAATIHAAQGVTVVLTVAVDGARLARTVAIRWHRTCDCEGLKNTGTPPADGAEGVTTITYSFAADRPGTFTYHARYGRDRVAGLVDVRGSEAGPSAGGRARTHAGPSAGRRARTATRHGGALDVPRTDRGPTADSRAVARPASTAGRRADGRARGGRGRGRASVEAQLMADCPVIYYDGAEYDGGAPVLRLLRWSAAALAAAALWVSGLCGPRDPDMHRRGSQHAANLS